ncbi:hypothetical protein XPA_010440 [Xanthoria parietina]
MEWAPKIPIFSRKARDKRLRLYDDLEHEDSAVDLETSQPATSTPSTTPVANQKVLNEKYPFLYQLSAGSTGRLSKNFVTTCMKGFGLGNRSLEDRQA